MSFAVLSALDVEIRLLVDSLDEPRHSRLGAWPIWEGTLSGSSVLLARAGLGKVNTAALAALVAERVRPAAMFFTGVAGSLDPTLQIGDIVVGAWTAQHDTGVSAPNGLEHYQPGHIPFFNPTDDFGYRPTESLLNEAREAARVIEFDPVAGRRPGAVFGGILTGDQFLNDTGIRAALFEKFGAQAIEMEGAALAQVADSLDIDHLIIRSVSDLAGEGSIDEFADHLDVVAENSARLVSALVDRLQ